MQHSNNQDAKFVVKQKTTINPYCIRVKPVEHLQDLLIQVVNITDATVIIYSTNYSTTRNGLQLLLDVYFKSSAIKVDCERLRTHALLRSGSPELGVSVTLGCYCVSEIRKDVASSAADEHHGVDDGGCRVGQRVGIHGHRLAPLNYARAIREITRKTIQISDVMVEIIIIKRFNEFGSDSS